MKIILLTIAIALSAACSKTNPNYCPGHPENNCNLEVDAPLGGNDDGVGCTASSQCPGQVCDTAKHLCVVCTAAEPSACTGVTPVCNTVDDTCRPCATDPDCASNACLPDGLCADPASVLYAAAVTQVAQTCAITDKCSLDTALALADATHNVIKLDSGTYALLSNLVIAKNVTLTGTGAVLDRQAAGNGPTVSITGGSVTLDYLTIQGGDDATLGYGIQCTGATVVGNQLLIQNNASVGLSTTNCIVTLSRSTVFGNLGGGVSIAGTSGTFDVSNNFIFRNGNSTNGVFGGVQLGLNPPGASRFEFNTIVDNNASTGSSRAGGVFCDIPFAWANNVVARNFVNNVATAANSQVFGICTNATSVIQNDVTGLNFEHPDGTPFSFKLLVGSTLIDQATTASSVDIDNSGKFRPQGGAKDIGADEFKP